MFTFNLNDFNIGDMVETRPQYLQTPNIEIVTGKSLNNLTTIDLYGTISFHDSNHSREEIKLNTNHIRIISLKQLPTKYNPQYAKQPIYDENNNR